MGSGGHRKACGERLAPTLREEGDDWGHSHGQTHTGKKNGPSLQTATTKSGNMKKEQAGTKQIPAFKIGHISFSHCTAHLLSGPKRE